MTSNNTTEALDWRKAWDHGVGEGKDRRRIRARAACDTDEIELGADESITGETIDRGSVKRMGPDCLTVVNAACPKKKRPLRQFIRRNTHDSPIIHSTSNPGLGNDR